VNVPVRRILAAAATSFVLAAAMATTVVAGAAKPAPGAAPGAAPAAAARLLAVTSLPVRAQPASSLVVRYVALGDSYSAGTGAGRYSAAGKSCERSASAFPQLWAARHDPASFVSVACAGATTATVRTRQLSALSARTTLVSITIGGNDVGFSQVMETCVFQLNSACVKAVNTAESSVRKVLPGRLDRLLRAIRTRAPLARIVVLGYPDLYDLSQSRDCIGIGTAKRAALNQGAGVLDRALSAAAARNHDPFADVRPEFARHEICDGSTSYLNAVTFPLDGSYHPNAAGQKSGYLGAFSRGTG
jgi:lysophospholipase L1-like esterase